MTQQKIPSESTVPMGYDAEFGLLGFKRAVFHIEAGARTFVDYSKAMLADLGDVALPYLRSWYVGIRHYPGFDNTGMTSDEEIDIQQLSLFNNEEQVTRTQLDQLLADSRLFHKSDDYKKLLDFIVCMRNFAPFNAMLLQVQKPGLRYAASSWDWLERFGRTVKQDARPLLILWPFGPVALVYDVLDTEGRELPSHVFAFPAKGIMTKESIGGFIPKIASKEIETVFFDAGDNKAGSIRRDKRGTKENEKSHYLIKINQNHNPNIQFATLVHELGHLFLGHLGLDSVLKAPDRRNLGDKQVELEAESVSFLVCSRHGVENSSESYLSNYVSENPTVDRLDIYQITRAAGHVESLLGLGIPTKFEPKKR